MNQLDKYQRLSLVAFFQGYFYFHLYPVNYSVEDLMEDHSAWKLTMSNAPWLGIALMRVFTRGFGLPVSLRS